MGAVREEILSRQCDSSVVFLKDNRRGLEHAHHRDTVPLTLNYFSFSNNHYQQINGVAMGTKMGPSYANLFVGYIENQFFNQYNGPQPKLYRRYIDDCVGATSSTREELEQFIYSVNSFHPALKYTWQISETSIPFLDINVSIHNNGLSIN